MKKRLGYLAHGQIFIVGFCVLIFLGIVWTGEKVQAQNTWYVATDGNDGNAGTDITNSFASIQKAHTVCQPGDTIYLRGGTYEIFSSGSTGIDLTKNGTSENRIYLWNFPGEAPVLDFNQMSTESGVTGVSLAGDYWHLKGIEITKAKEGTGNSASGMVITGSNNILELLDLNRIEGRALLLYSSASDNLVLNCDAHHNYDPLHSGGNADGFQAIAVTGVNNRFTGCRSWFNSDDGFDLWETEAPITIDNCWALKNGYIPDTPLPAGNGNGFKLGRNSTGPRHVIYRNLAVSNLDKGIDHNSSGGGMDIYNNTVFANTNVSFNIKESAEFNVKNNISYRVRTHIEGESGNDVSHNSWNLNIPLDENNFKSMDYTEMLRPRKADGSLPDIDFLNLSAGSELIDRGVDIGLAFTGNAPDLGAFEFGMTNSIEEDLANHPETSSRDFLKVYPVPSESGLVYLLLNERINDAQLSVFDINGKKLSEWALKGGSEISLELDSGMYILVCRIPNHVQRTKIIIH